MSHILDLSSCFLMIKFRSNVLWQEYSIGDVMYVSFQKAFTADCPSVGDTKFDYLVAMMMANSFQGQNTFAPCG